MIPSISARNYAREEHVDFQEIAREAFGMDDYHPLRAMYRRIRAKVPDADEPGLVYTGTFSSPFSEYEKLGVAGLRIRNQRSGVNLDWTPSRMWYENLWVVLHVAHAIGRVTYDMRCHHRRALPRLQMVLLSGCPVVRSFLLNRSRT